MNYICKRKSLTTVGSNYTMIFDNEKVKKINKKSFYKFQRLKNINKIVYICKMNLTWLKYKGIHPGIILERELQKRSLKKRPFALANILKSSMTLPKLKEISLLH